LVHPSPIVILGVVAIVTLLGACQDDPKKRGQIIVSLDTDMALPEEIDEVWMQVAVRGASVFNNVDNPYQVGPEKTQNQIPGTLTVVAGDDPSTPVSIRVAGKKLGVWRTYREIVTTIPVDRTALLRMPLQWLCDGSAKPGADSSDGSPGMPLPQSTCESGYACKAGTCQRSEVEVASLGDYDPGLVFGGAAQPADGACFDTVPCMIGGTIVQPETDCMIAKPDVDQFNVALRVPGDGICDESGTTCFVPLNAEHEEGWTTEDDRLTLPGAACERLIEGQASAVYVSDDCPTKTEAQPPCGEWSSVPRPPDTAAAPVVAQAEAKLATQVSRLIEPGAAVVPCCPLLHADDALYTCICPRDDKPKTKAELVAAPLDKPDAPIKVGELSWPVARLEESFGATVWDGALYFVDDQTIRRARLLDSDATTASILVEAGIYEKTTLLADDDALYMLANSTEGTDVSPVQLLRLGHDESITAFATGGNRPVFQFDHDDDAVFVPTDRDEPLPGGRIRRRSSVTRIDKQSGQRSSLLPETVLTVEDTSPEDTPHGGYMGVQVDAGTLFALFEQAPADDGTVGVALFAIDLGEPAPSQTPAPVYQIRIDPAVTRINLLGAVDGAALVTRIEHPRRDAPVRSSSVLMLPREGGAPRIVADFARDFPLQGLSTDDERVFWLNASGRLFALQRSL
jgi:hypothetical protein